ERFLLVHVPGILLGFLIVGVVVAASLAGLFLVRRRVALATLEQHNDVAGFIIAVIGGLYAVLLAFVVISVWDQFEAARADASREADLVGLLYADAIFFPGHAVSIRTDLRAYAQSVVDDDWKEMSSDQSDSSRTDRQLRVLLEDFRAIPVETTEEGAFYTESVKQLYGLADSRRLRVDASGNELPIILWTVLAVGGVITVGFSCFFGISHFGAHVLMVAALATMIALTLFVILSLDLPFTGDLQVTSDAMQQAIREFSHP
ncbi:MAG: DUF4239 domain-containing protein, partial [Pseudonocardiaceae bacterium]